MGATNPGCAGGILGLYGDILKPAGGAAPPIGALGAMGGIGVGYEVEGNGRGWKGAAGWNKVKFSRRGMEPMIRGTS